MPWKVTDLTGRTFGNVTVESYAGRSSGKRPRPQWMCVCRCGKRRLIFGSNLKQLKHTDSCYCNSPGEYPQRRSGLATGWNRVMGERNGEVRFWLGVRSSKDGCWEWQRCRTPQGYGQVAVDRVRWIAHRYSWHLHFGPIPRGLFVCHRCDNPPCVNPAHLFLGTHQDNMRDMAEKGRAARSKGRPHGPSGVRTNFHSHVGTKNPNGRLTEEAAKQIISRLATGELYTAIAADFPISHWAVAKIAQGRSWTHLPR